MGAQDKLNVGVLGGGFMAFRHLQSLLTLPVVEVGGLAASVVSPEVLELCRAGRVSVSSDPSSIFAPPGLDAVVIATPTGTHLELVLQAVAAGSHVFCEKPLALTAQDAQAAVDACASARVKLAVGHVVRYFPAYAAIRAAVVDGEVGPPGMARCRRMSGRPEGHWFRDPARSGGVIMDMGVHDFDWLRWCLGPVQRVSALATEQGAGDVAMVTLVHESGSISCVELSWMSPRGFETAVEVTGPKGLLRHSSRGSAPFSVDRSSRPESSARPKSSSLPETSSAVVELPGDEGLDNPYRLELAAALDWFGGGPPPRSSGEDAVAAVALAQAASASAARRQPVVMAASYPWGAR
jgi:predicted dehydrogenase